MSTKTKIKWRLGTLPTPEEVALLFDKGILDKDQAKEILFSLETDDDRDKKSLQDEIKFLRELVQKLSTNRSVIIEHIKEIEKPWRKQGWYQPYYYYTTSGGLNAGITTANYTSGTSTNAVYSLSSGSTNTDSQILTANYDSSTGFTDIKTF